MTSPGPPSLPPGRVAGIDYGRRRIGVAVCDARRLIASPLCVRQTTGDRAADAAFFRTLATEQEIVGFVVGLPVHADGSASAMSVEVERFATWLGATTGLPWVLCDERYSSREAAGLLAGVGLTRGRKRERSDAVAAQVVLQAWLDSPSRREQPGPLEG